MLHLYNFGNLNYQLVREEIIQKHQVNFSIQFKHVVIGNLIHIRKISRPHRGHKFCKLHPCGAIMKKKIKLKF